MATYERCTFCFSLLGGNDKNRQQFDQNVFVEILVRTSSRILCAMIATWYLSED